MNNYEGNNNTFVKYKTPSPCFNCVARKTYCHISCKKYNEYLQIHEKEKELMRKEMERYSDSIYRMEQVRNKISSNVGRNYVKRKR